MRTASAAQHLAHYGPGCLDSIEQLLESVTDPRKKDPAVLIAAGESMHRLVLCMGCAPKEFYHASLGLKGASALLKEAKEDQALAKSRQWERLEQSIVSAKTAMRFLRSLSPNDLRRHALAKGDAAEVIECRILTGNDRLSIRQRELQTVSYDALAALDAEHFVAPWTADDFRKRLLAPCWEMRLLTAKTKEGTLCGFILFGSRHDELTGKTSLCIVRAAATGKAEWKTMLEHLCAWAPNQRPNGMAFAPYRDVYAFEPKENAKMLKTLFPDFTVIKGENGIELTKKLR